MKIISVNVGRPREIVADDRLVRTSIFKSAVKGPVRVRGYNLEGDEQSDLTVHGGRDKAVYIYPSEHYAFWRHELDRDDLPWGAFGENLTLEGLLEGDVAIGDRLRFGTAQFVVTQPRSPCFKLAARLARPDIIRRFRESGRSGFYVAIDREGDLAAGDSGTLTRAEGDRLSIADITGLALAETPDRALLARAAALTGLSEWWRERLQARLTEIG